MKGEVFTAILDVIRRIPYGHVATYGQVARMAGYPGYARQVGYALSVCNDRSVPWHRVINARGEISPRTLDGSGEHIQRIRLEAEGIMSDQAGRIALRRYQWFPDQA